MIEIDQDTREQAVPKRSTLAKEVLLPFLGSRVLLVAMGYLSGMFPAYSKYPGDGIIERGWHFTSWSWLDFWCRWDTGWYLNIIERGYELRGDPLSVKSNIAFYPLYPYLVKTVALILPGTEDRIIHLLIGLLISNIASLIALVLLYRLTLFYLKSRLIARHTVWLLIAFPSGFILSCFYTEGLFLCLAVAAFWFGSQKKWLLSCLCVALVALCRPVGIGLALPLAVLYVEQINWKFHKIRPDALWFLIIPLGYLFFLYEIDQITGNFLHAFQVQNAWDRHLSRPWETLLFPNGWNIYHTPFQQVLTLVFLFGIYLAFKNLPSKSLGLLALLIILPVFFTGRLSSSPRFYLVVFPVFIAYAALIQKKWVWYTILIGCSLLQVIYFMGWVRFYWIF